MNIRKIDENFSVTGQISVADVKTLAEAGYRGIICARPDGEDAGQPAFAEIAAAAKSAGLKAVQIPVSGAPSDGQLASFKEALGDMDGPILGYCRSGGRAGNLYQATR